MQENKIGRNDPCWCGSGKKYKKCHEAIDERIAGFALKGHMVPRRGMLKTPEPVSYTHLDVYKRQASPLAIVSAQSAVKLSSAWERKALAG